MIFTIDCCILYCNKIITFIYEDSVKLLKKLKRKKKEEGFELIANFQLKQNQTNNKDVDIEDFSTKIIVLELMLGLWWFHFDLKHGKTR